MQENLPETEQPINEESCANCGSHAVLKDYPTKLCADCRQAFIKFPIPKWILGFAGGILLIVLYSMIKLPANLALGIHFEKGKKAMAENKYLTAESELAKVVDKAPNYTEAKCLLAIAAFHNQDFFVENEMFQQLKGVDLKDDALLASANEVIKEMDGYIPSDSMNLLLAKYNNNSDSIPDAILEKFISAYPSELYPVQLYASSLFNRNVYKKSDSLAQIALTMEPDFMPAISLRAGTLRYLKQYDSAIYFNNLLLAQNVESVYAISSKARTLLMQKKDAEALKTALEAQKLKQSDGYNLATLAIIYHLTGKLKERDAIVSQTQNDSLAIPYMKYANEVISGKQKFRD